MKIKTKLLTLIFIIIISMSASITVYVAFTRFTNALEDEKNALQVYRNQMEDSHTELFRFLLDSYVIVDQFGIFNKSLDVKKEGFENVLNITKLKDLNEDIAQAIKNVSNLENYQSESLIKFNSSSDELLSVVNDIMGTDQNFILNSLSSTDGGLNGKDLAKLRYYIKKMKNEINFMDVAMQTSINIIDDQYSIIDKNVDDFKQRGNIIALSIFLLVLIFSIVLSSKISKNIVLSITKIGNNLSIMSKGDLTHEIVVESKDEISSLSEEMNDFQDELNLSLEKIKGFSLKNEENKVELIKTASSASVASEQISANINSVDDQINTLNNNIFQSNNQINQISTFTSDLNNHISDQMAMVEESIASITQMIASIKSVSSLTDKNMTIVECLQTTAKDGDTQITETTDRISDINESVQKIGAMAEVIQNISEQTNLLAMNAAIEAAHAGDAGKGFAVVADEIRKLSEASAVSSTDIAKNLKDIVQKFDKASVSGVKTREAFANIYSSIKDVTEALYAVSSSTSELNIGGTQILEAMDSLSQISSEVQNKSEGMIQSTTMMKEGIEEVSQISANVTQAMDEVNVGFSGIRESITGLEIISSQVGYVSEDLNTEVSKFKTKSEKTEIIESEEIE